MPVDYYQTRSGRSPIVDFLEDIERGNPGSRAKCLTALDMLNEGTLPHRRTEKVHNQPSVWELRVTHRGEEYRLFFGRHNDVIIVCNALHKKTQKIPKRIIDQAVDNINDYLRDRS